MVYELTRKSPGKLRPGTAQAIVYETMRTLRRAEQAKVIDVVLHTDGYRSRQADPAQQVRFYLWKFRKAGVLRLIPDRRYIGAECADGAAVTRR